MLMLNSSSFTTSYTGKPILAPSPSYVVPESEAFDIIAKEIKAVLDGKLTDQEIDAAKSFGLGRYQMGAQTVSQISGFYTNRYFADDFIKDYDKVPDMIRRVTREKIMVTAQSFVDANTWVLAAVSSGDKDELIELNDKVETLFEKSE